MVTSLTARAVVVASLVLGAVLQPGGEGAESIEPGPREQLVRDFNLAFNERDLEGLLSMVEDDVEWLSVSGHQVGVDAGGKEALRASLEAYFRACASCTSTLEWVRPAGSRVAALERASWQTAEGEASQRSLSVYEFGETGIRRVYYYPADPVRPAKLR